MLSQLFYSEHGRGQQYFTDFSYGDRVVWLLSLEWGDEWEYGTLAVSLLKDYPFRVVSETPGMWESHETPETLEQFMLAEDHHSANINAQWVRRVKE